MSTKNKQDLVEIMADRADISKAAAEKALTAFTDYVTETLKNGDEISIIGFGGFKTSKRAERAGRNPHTGAEMVIPAAVVAKFKAGKKLKEAVNND